MGDNHDSNKGTNLQTAGVILFLVAATFAVYGIILFVRWLWAALYQFYLYIGGTMGVARMLTLALGVFSWVMAWVSSERWAHNIFVTLTGGAAMMFIMAWFVSNLEQLPQFFCLGAALYWACTVLLTAWNHYFTDLHKETKTK